MCQNNGNINNNFYGIESCSIDLLSSERQKSVYMKSIRALAALATTDLGDLYGPHPFRTMLYMATPILLQWNALWRIIRN